MERSSRIFLLLRDAPSATRRVVVLATWLGQFPLVILLEPYLSAAVASISLVVIALAALAFGMRAGVISSIASQAVYTPIFVIITETDLGGVLLQSIPTGLVLVATALIVGKLTDLADALRAAEAEQRSSREQLHREANRLAALLDAVPDTILHLGSDGRIIAHRISEQFGRYADRHGIEAGRRPGGVVGDWIASGLDTLSNGGSSQIVETHELVEDTGMAGTLEIRFARHGEEVMVSIRDITDQRAAEQRDRLAALIEEKDRFLASISHELRTPVTGIYGFAVMMRENLPPDDEATAEIAEIIVDQSRDLGFLIEDLLVASRLDIGEVSIRPTETTIHDIIEATLSSFPENDVTEETPDTQLAVLADPLRVRQIVRNLISNALRYGGPEISVRADAEGDEVTLAVCDNGQGIPAELHEAVFASYSSAHDRPGETDAVGIGLNVSRRLAELMSGKLTYERVDDITIFTLRLPAAGATDIDAPHSVALTAGATSRSPAPGT